MSTVATICKRIPAGVSVVCPFVLLCPAACPQGTQGGGLASLCPPLREIRLRAFSATRAGPRQTSGLAPARCRARAGRPREAPAAAGGPPVAPACMMACAAPQGGKTGGVYPPGHWRPVPPPMGAEKGPFFPLIFPLYAVIESRIKGRRMPPEAAKQAENPTESGAYNAPVQFESLPLRHEEKPRKPCVSGVFFCSLRAISAIFSKLQAKPPRKERLCLC